MSEPLAYLFTATFKDGSVIQQTQEDKSQTGEGKSAFYDVDQRISEVSTFSIESPSVKATVDLNTGLFTMNGVGFYPSNPSVIDNFRDVKEHRLIYFRRHRRDLENGVEVNHDIEYHIGWQTTLDDGKNYKQTISLD
jgi:hypothetical protein